MGDREIHLTAIGLILDHRDLDQVHADLRSPKHLTQHKTTKPAEDLPGLGRWYCIECAKWFEGEHSLVQHRKGKNHKRRYEQGSLGLPLFTQCGLKWLAGYVLCAKSHTRKRKPKLQWV